MTTTLLLGVVVLVGSFVQASLGFGIAVVAAPFVVLLEPELMPASLLVLGLVLPLLQLLSGPRDVDRRLLGWALGGRLALTPVGAWLVHVLPTRGIAVAVGLLVLVSTVLSIRTVETTARPSTALGAGAITGVSGTAASIGGPFLAIVLQHEDPVRIRSTLSAFFVVGSSASLLSLAVSGQVTREQMTTSAVWVPFVVAGMLLARPVQDRLPRTAMRHGVLALCAVSSVVVTGRALLT